MTEIILEQDTGKLDKEDICHNPPLYIIIVIIIVMNNKLKHDVK